MVWQQMSETCPSPEFPAPGLLLITKERVLVPVQSAAACVLWFLGLGSIMLYAVGLKVQCELKWTGHPFIEIVLHDTIWNSREAWTCMCWAVGTLTC